MRIDVPTSADGSSGGTSGGGGKPPAAPAARGGHPRGERLAPVIPISAARRRRNAGDGTLRGVGRRVPAGPDATAATRDPVRGAAPRPSRAAASPTARRDPRLRVRRRPEAGGEAVGATVGVAMGAAAPGRRHLAGRNPGGPVRRSAPRRPVRIAANGRVRPRRRGPRHGERAGAPPIRLTRRGRVVLVTTVLTVLVGVLLGGVWLGTRVAAIAAPACAVPAAAEPQAAPLAVPGR